MTYSILPFRVSLLPQKVVENAGSQAHLTLQIVESRCYHFVTFYIDEQM